jgi:hypothetical protein
MFDKNIRKRDQQVFRTAKSLLLTMAKSAGLSKSEMDRYLTPRPRMKSLGEIYLRILKSMSTAGMNLRVIRSGIGEMERMSGVLFDFNPAEVCKHYSAPEQVLAAIKRGLQPKGKVREEKNSVFPKLCRTILSGAKFLSRFPTADEFYSWAELFNVEDDDIRVALPMVLHRNIHGMGIALSCDFLKEIGFEHFGKPDTWIKKEFEALGLSEKKSSEIQILRDMFRVARHTHAPAYQVDKVFWLIGSGNFHPHKIKSGMPALVRDVKKRLRR